ncbi:MAG: glycosyltransferase family 39 protein [Deltaproteobacteria bacterium]|nr:glycosyltransferase family 39 protein [Deltaproteobacteria bacterium]
MVDVSVIIPTLNERANIDSLLSRILKTGSSCSTFNLEIIVVDDGSTDGTRECVQGWESNYHVRLLARDGERGLATAILSGAKIAKGNIILAMDADLSHPPEKIPQLVETIIAGSHDMVVGSRYVSGGSTPDWTFFRRMCSRFAKFLAKPLTDVNDPLSGFFAIRREILVGFQKDIPGFKIGLELLVSEGNALRVTEIPIQFQDRQKGKSKFNLHIIFSYLRQLVNLAGGNISITTGSRLAIVGLFGALIDFSIFKILLANGNGISTAHVISFFMATVSGFILNDQWSFAGSNETIFQVTVRKYTAFLLITVFTLFIRGGVLAIFTIQWNGSPQAAILVAIGVAALLTYLGNIFFIFPKEDFNHDLPVKWRILAIGIVGYILLLRLVYLGLPELLQEEAYYWNYAQHLNIGYLDHPPMVAWLIWLSTTLLGNTEFAVRMGAYICWLISSAFIFGLTRNLFDKSTAFRSLILLAILPIFFATGFVMTPDAPLITCWAGTLHFLERALIGERQTAWWGAGVCMGLGMLSKYTIVLLAPATLLFLLVDSRSRKWFYSPKPYMAAIAALLLFSPVILWNLNNDWASFVFQGPRRIHGSFDFSVGDLIAFVIILLTPTGAISAFYIICKRISLPGHVFTGDVARRQKFAIIFTVLPLSVFFIFSITRNVKLSWTGPLWLMIVPFVAYYMVPDINRQTKCFFTALQRFWPATVVITTLIYCLTLHYVVLGLPGVPYPTNSIFLGWQKMAQQIESIENEIEHYTGLEPLVVGMDKYRVASELAFYRTKIEKDPVEQLENEGVLFTSGRHLFGGNSLMYSFWQPKQKVRKKHMILVSRNYTDLQKQSINSHIDEMGEIHAHIIKKNGVPIDRYYYCIVEGYRPYPS